ncbi:CzcE family metal-binding protein [Oxalobacteraceae bacterium OTU3CINTB1]|nr:CzcE family metal-binding protein [Oxalobacteraceae bacterium OTU3CINTB1]
MKKFLTLAALVICMPLTTLAANKTNVNGTPATADAGARVINILAKTKHVNVTQGETVKFVVGDKSFAWHFDTLRGSTSFALSKIAPKEIDTHRVRVFVAPNPLYHGG